MTAHFREYFDMENVAEFNSFIRYNPDKIIFTDHFTKYSIDLIDGFKEQRRTVRLKLVEENNIPEGSLVVFHTGHVSEIYKQGFEYPKESYYRENGFEEINSFGSFIIFEKKSKSDAELLP
jgi:hypothetical protein